VAPDLDLDRGRRLALCDAVRRDAPFSEAELVVVTLLMRLLTPDRETGDSEHEDDQAG
jgi:hypothetical protein